MVHWSVSYVMEEKHAQEEGKQKEKEVDILSNRTGK